MHAVPRRHGLALPHGRPHRARRRSATRTRPLNNVADNIAGRTICDLGDAAALPVKSFIKNFRDEFQHHIDHKTVPGRSLRVTAMADLNIEIDGRQTQVRRDHGHRGRALARHLRAALLLSQEAVDRSELSMCLVQVEKAPKPLTACATPGYEAMKVHTASEQAVTARRA